MPNSGLGHGYVNFSWVYSSTDIDPDPITGLPTGIHWDVPQYRIRHAGGALEDDVIEKLPIHLNLAGDMYVGSGRVQVHLDAGDAFSFEVETLDGLFDPGVLTISGLQLAPEPSEWAAISFGVLGLVWLGKKRFAVEAR